MRAPLDINILIALLDRDHSMHSQVEQVHPLRTTRAAPDADEQS